MSRLKQWASYGFWAFDIWDDVMKNTNNVKNVAPKASAICEVDFITVLFVLVFVVLLYILKHALLIKYQ
jgi:hypothetical protein